MNDGTDAGPDAAVAAEPFDAGASNAEPALAAPPGSRRWTADGMRLDAPDGKELLYAIVRDVDGDGKKDALALVRPVLAENAKDWDVGPGELLFYRGTGGAPISIAVAPAARVDAACAPLARLSKIGPRSALAELGSTCSKGSSHRELYVVRLVKDPSIDFETTVLDPAGAPRMAVDVDGADRDHDGIDDVALRITIEGGAPPFEPGPRLSAKLAFFDRSSGESRDPEEPDASLRAIAAQAAAKANKTKEAATVPGLVAQMRALYRAMCAEGGAPRLIRRGGPISCGTQKAIDDAGVAEVRALVAVPDPLRALAASDAVKGRSEVAPLLEKVAPFSQAKAARTLAFSLPAAKSPHPAWGVLAFEPSGKLLVRGDSKVTRVDPSSYADEEATGVAPWPLQVIAPNQKSRWLEAYHACEGVAYRATFVSMAGDADLRDVLLPVVPPLGLKCTGSRGEPAVSLPLAWSSRGLEAMINGQAILLQPDTSQATLLATLLDEPPSLGSARSPNGKVMAIPSRTGIIVRQSNGKVTRFRAPELEPYEDVRQCTISDDATHLACNRKGKLVVATYDAP